VCPSPINPGAGGGVGTTRPISRVLVIFIS
jgi:hypothetical protein